MLVARWWGRWWGMWWGHGWGTWWGTWWSTESCRNRQYNSTHFCSIQGIPEVRYIVSFTFVHIYCLRTYQRYLTGVTASLPDINVVRHTNAPSYRMVHVTCPLATGRSSESGIADNSKCRPRHTLNTCSVMTCQRILTVANVLGILGHHISDGGSTR